MFASFFSSNQLARFSQRYFLIIIIGLILSVFPISNALANPTIHGNQVLMEDEYSASFVALPDNQIEIELRERVLIGENFKFYVTFDEASSDTGYRPFVDLLFPSNGADGAAGTDTPDGIDFVEATLLDVSLNAITQTFPDADGPDLPETTGCVSHPFARDASGNAIQVCGTAGDSVVTLELPFSSITPDMPKLWIKVEASVSELADVDHALTIKSRSGYAYGSDYLDNPCCDLVVLSHTSTDGTSWPELEVTPQVIYIEKEYDGPVECPYLLDPFEPVLNDADCPYADLNPVYETVTGPNYNRHYTIKIDVADGQTITDLDVTDYFPTDIAFLSLVSTNPVGTTITSPTVGVAQNAPDNELLINFSSVSGDAEVVIEFFIPELDADANPILDPTTGDEVVTDNIASGIGDWIPVDTRDVATADNALANDCPDCVSLHTLHLRSLAVQKNIEIETDTGVAGYSPGDRVKYTIDFQVSDYFTFGDLVLTDILYDGQRIDFSAGYEPVFSISDRNTTLVDTAFAFTAPPTAAATTDDLIIDESAIGNSGPGLDATDGSTTLTFDLSLAMTNNGQADGVLEGGEVGTTDDPAQGTIVFYAIIQEDFSDEYPSGDASVDHDDAHFNVLTFEGSIRDNASITTTIGQEENDSTIKFKIEHGHISKSIYAVNGSTTFSPEIQPDDTITFRIKFPLPTSDSDNLEIVDYLSMPIFDASEVVVFNDTVDSTPPAAGNAQYGPDDTYQALFGAGGLPTITSDTTANSLLFDFGSFDDPTNTTTEIDILFTVTMSADPYTNGVSISNLAQTLEERTNNDTHWSLALDVFTLKEPGISLRKSVVASDNANAFFNIAFPASVSFEAPGSIPSWTGSISSDDQDAGTNLINSNAFELSPDDIVTFAIVLENLGDSTLGAFDISVKDAIPANMSIPENGLNLQFLRGDGTVMSHTPVGSTATDSTGLFDDGVFFEDDSALIGAAHVFDTTSGENIIIITYDLQIDAGVAWGTEIINTATLLSYAGMEGEPNHVGATPTSNLHTDDAVVTLLPPGEAVGELGGSVRASRWQVNVPAGLLEDGSFVSILAIDQAAGLGLGTNFRRLDSTVNIRIYDPERNLLTSFTPPLEICYYYTADNLNAVEDDIEEFIINTAPNEFSSWNGLETYKDPDEDKVCAVVDHLSIFTVSIRDRSDAETDADLPDTGFAPGVLTSIDAQPEENAYVTLGDLWLEIPSLGVQIPIAGVPQVDGNWDVTWLENSAGYLMGTAFPTWAGNTALTAHVYDSNGAPGPFVDLNNLGFGDTVIIHAWGLKYEYLVQTTQQVVPEDTSVLGAKVYDWVTLLTCEDFDENSNSYEYRRAVQAMLVSIEKDN